MSKLFARLLLLASGIVAAFPPGWCCLPRGRHIEPTSAPTQQPCCHPRQAEHSDRPADRLPPIRTCCCDSQDLVLPSEIDTPQPDVAVSSVLPILAVEQASVPFTVEDGADVPLERSLQLLHCVWRC